MPARQSSQSCPPSSTLQHNSLQNECVSVGGSQAKRSGEEREGEERGGEGRRGEGRGEEEEGSHLLTEYLHLPYDEVLG